MGRVPAIFVALCLGLAACGGMPGVALEAPVPDAGAGPAVEVRVTPVDGPAVPMARLLAQSVADGLNALHVAASAKVPGLSRYVLKGRAEANRGALKVPYVMVIHWTLFDAAGEPVALHTQGVPGSRWQWDYGDPRVIDAVGAGAARPIAALVRAGTR